MGSIILLIFSPLSFISGPFTAALAALWLHRFLVCPAFCKKTAFTSHHPRLFRVRAPLTNLVTAGFTPTEGVLVAARVALLSLLSFFLFFNFPHTHTFLEQCTEILNSQVKVEEGSNGRKACRSMALLGSRACTDASAT